MCKTSISTLRCQYNSKFQRICLENTAKCKCTHSEGVSCGFLKVPLQLKVLAHAPAGQVCNLKHMMQGQCKGRCGCRPVGQCLRLLEGCYAMGAMYTMPAHD